MDVPHSPLRGGSMEPYTVVRRLGTGTYGSAYLVCLKSDSSTQFVLKKIRLDKVSDKEREAAEQEVQLLKALDHAFVLQFHNAFIYKNHLCIITEYCEAGDLYTYLKGRKTLLPEAQVLEWFIQIALAVQHCHGLKVLHRDLKTQNIFLTRNGDVKLGDFGISRVLKGPTEMASTIVGTPYYMSPEILECKPYDFKSDIWSLGCVLYELATLKHAFDASDMNGLVMKVLRGRILPLPDGYSGALANLINKMLSKSPRGRPTMDLMLSAEFLQDVCEKTVAKATMLSKGRTVSTRTGSDRTLSGEAQQDTVLRDRLLDMTAAAAAKTGRRPMEEPNAAAATRKRNGRVPEGEQQQAVTGRRARPGAEAPRAGELEYAVCLAEEELRRIQDERDAIRQQAMAFHPGDALASPAWGGPEPALPTFGAEGSLHHFIVGDEPTPKDNGKHYWEDYDDWQQQAGGGGGTRATGRGRTLNVGRRNPVRTSQPELQMGYDERLYDALNGDAPAAVQNTQRRRDVSAPRNAPPGAAYYGSSPSEDPVMMHPGNAAAFQASDPRARMEARKLEMARKREEELLAARKKYFEERRHAESKKRELYEHSNIMQAGDRDWMKKDSNRQQPEMALHIPMSTEKKAEHAKARQELEAEMELEGAVEAPRRPELLPTTSFVKGQVSDRVWELRRACMDSLGEALFQQVYCMMKARLNGEFGNDDTSEFINEVASLLGRDRLHHIAIMDQLLYFEEKV